MELATHHVTGLMRTRLYQNVGSVKHAMKQTHVVRFSHSHMDRGIASVKGSIYIPPTSEFMLTIQQSCVY